MKVVFITKDYFECDAPADAKCGKQERAAAEGHTQQHAQTSSGCPTQGRGSLEAET